MTHDGAEQPGTGDLSSTQIAPAALKVLGHYELIREIGSGGMGRVYLSRDVQLDRTVALKILPPEFSIDRDRLKRFIREAKAASALNHPNVATIHGIGEAEGVHFIAMEFIDGETLSEKIRKGPMSASVLVPLAIQLADALSEAHAHGIIHRDIKPGNVMVNARGLVKVLDFGVARQIGNPEQPSETDLTGQALIGTIPYMSPEQILARNVDFRSDIFSVGTLLYEMATGHLPFKGASPVETLNLITSATPSKPSSIVPGIDARLERIITRCLEKDPSARYASASDLLGDLRILNPSPADSYRVEPPPVATGSRHRKWLVAAIATSLMAAVSFAFWTFVPLVKDRAAQENIVVLPFESPDEAEGSGLAESVNAGLLRLNKELPVQIVSSSEARGRGIRTVQDARIELGAKRVVTGKLQRDENGLRAVYRIVDAATSKPLTNEITIRSNDVLSIRDHLVESIARDLNLKASADSGPVVLDIPRKPGAYEYYLQGRGYLQFSEKPENIDNAIAVFQRALTLDSDYGLAYAGLGESYWAKYTSTKDQQWIEPARAACERALALDEKAAAPHSCLGAVENGMGKYEKAAEEFQHALERNPTEGAAYTGLARAYDGLRQPERAEQSHSRAIAARPQYWAGYFNLGTYYQSKGRYPDAERMFDQVVALAPDNMRGYTNLGAMYFFQGKTDDAIRAFEKSLKIRPTYQAASNLGTLYFYEKADYSRAASAYRQALSLNGNDYRVWGNLASVLKKIGDTGKSMDALRQARQLVEARLQLNPRDSSALGALADYLASLGDKDQARARLEEALRLSPDDPALLFRAATIYEGTFSDRDAAVDALAKAVRHGHSWKEVQQSPTLEKLRQDPRFKVIEASRVNK